MTTAEPSRRIETADIEDTNLLAFYRDMDLAERHTFWSCFAGWTLDGMDFMIYTLVIGTIIAVWKVDAAAAGLAGSATLLSSAIGGWLGGYLSDRIGRVRTLQYTILWFSFFSLVCAFVQNFDQLLIARAVLGFGFGGEWAAGAVLMGEAIRPQFSRPRGRLGAIRLGYRLGPCRHCPGHPVFTDAGGDSLALDVCGRLAARAAGVLCSQLCQRA